MNNERGEILEIMVFIVIIIIFVTLFVLLFSCIKEENDYGTKEGKVTDKKYSSAYTTMMYNGKFYIPQYHPAKWQIKIEKEINGEIKSIWVYVDETTYHEFNIGDSYPGGKI